MTEVANLRFTPTAEELYHVGHQTCNIIPRGAKERCLSQVAEVLRFRLELKPVIALLRGELYARQAFARGDDMCYMVVIPSIRLYRFEVGNILGEVQDTINRRYGIYLHHSDLSMEQADGNPHESRIQFPGCRFLIFVVKLGTEFYTWIQDLQSCGEL